MGAAVDRLSPRRGRDAAGRLATPPPASVRAGLGRGRRAHDVASHGAARARRSLHNIPEGLAVGVAFGAVSAGFETATLGGAIALAIGIGLQNCPEGTAVSVPLRREGVSPMKSFYYGQMTAWVEPIAAVLGAAAVLVMRPILPYALAFAAGAMMFVVVEEVIPESQTGGHPDVATSGAILGFAVMMVLDVALG